MIKQILTAGGACALVAGVAVAGAVSGSSSASASAPAAAPAAAPVLAASAGTAAADLALLDDGSAAPATPATLRARCARLPQAEQRTRDLERVLAAGVRTPGSLAYLRARIAAARAQGHTGEVTRLEARLAFRTQLAGFLPQRLSLLEKAGTTICATPAP